MGKEQAKRWFLKTKKDDKLSSKTEDKVNIKPEHRQLAFRLAASGRTVARKY
jgi:hypothetical protein